MDGVSAGPDSGSDEKLEPELQASYPLVFIDFCVSQGLDEAAMFRVAGLDPSARDDPDALVEYDTMVRLWVEATKRLPDRPVGPLYARHLATMPGRAMGVMGYALTHCRDLRQAFELVIRYSALVDPQYTITLEVHEGLARVVVDHAMRRSTGLMEYLVATVANTLWLARERVPPITEVCFRHPAAHPAEVYAQFFSAPLRFESPWYGLSFDAAALQIPIAGADPRLGEYLRQRADALLEERGAAQAPEPIDARVRQVIDDGLMAGQLDQESAARRLGMSARTLQRALSAVDTSFTAQVDAVRRGRAMQLIKQPGLSVAEVAFMLGYGDPRSFYRNFRRWTGENPTAYRRSHLAAH